MSGYLGRLAARSLGIAEVARPVIPPLYADWRSEPSGPDGEHEPVPPEIVEERLAPVRPRAVRGGRPAVDEADESDHPVVASPRARDAPRVTRAQGPDVDVAPAFDRSELGPIQGRRPARIQPATDPRPEEAGSAPAISVSTGRVLTPIAVPMTRAGLVLPTTPQGEHPAVLDRRPAREPTPAERTAILALTAPLVQAPPVMSRRASAARDIPAVHPSVNGAPEPDDRTVEISIGRIEIRAVPGSAPAGERQASPRRTAVSLEAYLGARSREGRA